MAFDAKVDPLSNVIPGPWRERRRTSQRMTLLGQIYVICVLAFAVSVLIMAVGS